MVRRILLVFLAVMMLIPAAGAESLIDLSAFERVPLEVTLSAEVKSHMPLDEVRAGELNALLSHVQLCLRTEMLPGETWCRAEVLVDGTSTVSMTERQRDDEAILQASCLPGVSFQAQGMSALDQLMGTGDVSLLPFGLKGDELTWLDDGAELLAAFRTANPERIKTTKKSQTIKDIGKAATTETLTVSKDDAAALKDELLALCPEGRLHSLIETLSFTGKQTFTMLCTKEGEICKVTYAGKCGSDEAHMRNVTLTWKLKREGEDAIDIVTLKSPEVSSKGTDRNTLTLERRREGTAVKLTADYSERMGGVKWALSGEADLNVGYSGGATEITGTINMKETDNSGQVTQLVLCPELAVDENAAEIRGTLDVEQIVDQANNERAVISIQAVPLTDYPWTIRENTTVYEALSEEQLAAENERLMTAASTALLRALVQLPKEDTLFLSRDLTDEAWAGIVEAAQSGRQN